jgi:hypothetical protein
MKRVQPQQTAISPQTCLIKSGAHTNAILAPAHTQRILAHVDHSTIFLARPAWLSAYRVQGCVWREGDMRFSGSHDRATDQIVPGTSSSSNAMHAIIRFSRYIADLEQRQHHSLHNSEHAPRSWCEQAVTTITPRAMVSLLGFIHTFSANSLHFGACERALMWLALRLPDVGSLGRI